MQTIYKKIFLEALKKNFLMQNGEFFFFKIALLSKNENLNNFFIFISHFLGFFLSSFAIILFGFFLSKFSMHIKRFNENKMQTKKRIEFANFFYKFGYLLIFLCIIFSGHISGLNYILQIFFLFFGYSIGILKIFSKNKETIQKFAIFFPTILLCAKLLNIYFIIK